MKKYKIVAKVVVCICFYLLLFLQLAINQFELDWSGDEFISGVCFKGRNIESVLKAFKPRYIVFEDKKSILEYCSQGYDCPGEWKSDKLYYLTMELYIFLHVNKRGVIVDYELRGS